MSFWNKIFSGFAMSALFAAPAFADAEKDREKIRKKAEAAVDVNKGQAIPTWLEANPGELSGRVTQLPRREDVPHPINEQLIVELCSR